MAHYIVTRVKTMKIELETTDIEQIVQGVTEQITPLLRKNSKSSDNELMTVKDVSQYLKVKESWVYEKIHTRGIPFKKIGRFPRFRKRDIDLWYINPYHPDLSHYNLKLT